MALVRELRLELFSLKKAEQVLDGLLKQARAARPHIAGYVSAGESCVAAGIHALPACHNVGQRHMSARAQPEEHHTLR